MGKLIAAIPSEPQGGERRKPSVREDDAERSGERNRESTYRNRMRGVSAQGERARDREALAIKGLRRRSGDCAGKVTTLTWGDLASRLKGRRPSKDDAEREVSRGRSTGREVGRSAQRHRRAGSFTVPAAPTPYFPRSAPSPTVSPCSPLPRYAYSAEPCSWVTGVSIRSGTVSGPSSQASSAASRRARVAAQYLGASSRYRSRGQCGRTRKKSRR